MSPFIDDGPSLEKMGKKVNKKTALIANAIKADTTIMLSPFVRVKPPYLLQYPPESLLPPHH